MRRSALGVMGALAAGLLTASCSFGLGTHSNTAADNQLRATKAAEQLLAKARVPPGSTELPAAPQALPGPVMGTPQDTSLIDKARFWSVPMPFADALAWVEAHPPAGLPQSGSMSGSGVPGSLGGYSYVGPVSDAWTQAQLEVGVAPLDEHTSAIRADGMAIWLDPRPLTDDRSGSRIRVTIAGGCPSSDKGMVGVTNSGDDLQRQLLPTGRPTAALVCQYSGLGDTPFSLKTQTNLGAAAAQRLAASVRKTPLRHTGGGITSCPGDDGSATVIAFAYKNRDDVDLWYARTGCQSVSNGSIAAGVENGLL